MSPLRIIVSHASYGCDTGCCGHVVYLLPEDFEVHPSMDPWEIRDAAEEYDPTAHSRRFSFSHPDSNSEEDKIAFAKQMVREEYGEEHVADLDWDNCHIEEW